MIRPITPITRTKQVRHAILELIFSGALRPGERLVEARLAEQFGVSQATVNAALQTLHDQGIATKILNRSTNIARYTGVEIENLFTVRLILEPEAARYASQNLQAEGRAALLRHVDAMRRSTDDLSQFCLADYSFHQEIFRITNNPVMIQACQAIAAAPFAYILCDRLSALPTNYAQLAEDHYEVILSLDKGPAAAARFTRERIEAWRQHSLRALDDLAVERRHYA